MGLASAEGSISTERFALMLTAMLSSQLAIGWTNDYVDRESDAIYQPSKPVPSGLVNANSLPPAIIATTFVSFIVGAFLGLVPLVFLTAGTAAGLAYDLVLKDTRLSPLAFVLAFAVLPPFVWSSLDAYRPELLAIYLVGPPLALAAHIANVLPDIKTDAAARRFNLAVSLGRARSLRLLEASLLLPPLLTVATLPFVVYDRRALAATLVTYGVLLAVANLAYNRPGRDADVWGFRSVVLASVLFAAGWLAAV
ncbi:MAG TPA: UbiA family prenyltransferase [Dehalococcoidia bacterium]|nr:UbiA family prenyltransferase [Dehalococcoidia bacterium]